MPNNPNDAIGELLRQAVAWLFLPEDKEAQLRLSIEGQLVKHMQQTIAISESEAGHCRTLLHQSSWREAITELIDMPWVSQHFKSSKWKELTSHDLLKCHYRTFWVTVCPLCHSNRDMNLARPTKKHDPNETPPRITAKSTIGTLSGSP